MLLTVTFVILATPLYSLSSSSSSSVPSPVSMAKRGSELDGVPMVVWGEVRMRVPLGQEWRSEPPIARWEIYGDAAQAADATTADRSNNVYRFS